jgi:hypothetical protein
MARGLSLEQLLYNLRSEVGQSTNPAISRSTRARFITIMNRIQRRLYADYDWPFLKIHRDLEIAAGQRYYDFPTDIDTDRSTRLEVKDGGRWQKVGYKITNDQMNEYDSDQDQRSSPVWRWDFYLPANATVPQIEVWPIPAENYDATTLEDAVRVHGIQKLVAMVNDADTCLIDGDLIVLYAAAEILAKIRAADSAAKLENANTLYKSLKGRATPSDNFTVGGDTFTEKSAHRPRELVGAIYVQEP